MEARRRKFQQFISQTKEWNWHSDQEHNEMMEKYKSELDDPESSNVKKEWIRIFLKGVKEQRAAAAKSFISIHQVDNGERNQVLS